MPSKNQTEAAYLDCFRTMDMALNVGGVRVEFLDKSAATVFRHRCYKGRSMLYNLSKGSVPKGVLPSTAYDDILIRFESDVKPGGSDAVLVFALRSKQAQPMITDLDGNPVTDTGDYMKLDLPGITLDD